MGPEKEGDEGNNKPGSLIKPGDVRIVEHKDALPWWAAETTTEEIKIQRVSKIATILKDIIESKKLYRMIGDKKHVYVEGWTALGGLLGAFPHVDYSRRMPPLDYITYESRVTWRTLSGLIVTSAEAMCSSKEENWKNREEYAIRSMSQTRAISKCGRAAFSWVMVFAGYEATPAEEMENVKDEDHGTKKKAEKSTTKQDEKKNGTIPPSEEQLNMIINTILASEYIFSFEYFKFIRTIEYKLMTKELASSIIDNWLKVERPKREQLKKQGAKFIDEYCQQKYDKFTNDHKNNPRVLDEFEEWQQTEWPIIKEQITASIKAKLDKK